MEKQLNPTFPESDCSPCCTSDPSIKRIWTHGRPKTSPMFCWEFVVEYRMLSC